MKQEHINFIRLRYSTLENIPPFIIIGDAAKGKTNMIKVMISQMMQKGKVFLFDSKDMELYFD